MRVFTVLIYSYTTADTFGSRVVIKYKDFAEVCTSQKEGLYSKMVLNAVTIIFSLMRKINGLCFSSSRTSRIWHFLSSIIVLKPSYENIL